MHAGWSQDDYQLAAQVSNNPFELLRIDTTSGAITKEYTVSQPAGTTCLTPAYTSTVAVDSAASMYAVCAAPHSARPQVMSLSVSRVCGTEACRQHLLLTGHRDTTRFPLA